MGIEPSLLPETSEVPAAQRGHVCELFPVNYLQTLKKTPNLKEYTHKQTLNLWTWKR